MSRTQDHNDIGQLTEQIMLQYITQSKEYDGGVRKSRVDITKVWAKIENVSAFERASLGRQETTDVKKVTMYYRDDITADMGFEWLTGGGQLYKFLSFPEKVGQKNFFVVVNAEGLHV